MNNELKKAQMGAETLKDFCNQFGADVHGQILLEVLFEGLINAEALFVFGEQEQEGTQVDHSPTEQGASELPDNGSERTGASEHLGTPDFPDYP